MQAINTNRKSLKNGLPCPAGPSWWYKQTFTSSYSVLIVYFLSEAAPSLDYSIVIARLGSKKCYSAAPPKNNILHIIYIHEYI